MGIHLIHDLQRLEDDLLLLCGRVESQLHASVAALRSGDLEAAGRIVDSDDDIDTAEVRLEEECLKILALHQPVARDLRQVVVILKINSEMERIGDMAVVVAKATPELAASPGRRLPEPVFELARLAEQLVADAVNAFVNEDSARARHCLEQVERAVGIEQQAKMELMEARGGSGEDRGWTLQAFEVLHAFRRVTARSANMAEDIVYMLDGEIIRHLH